MLRCVLAIVLGLLAVASSRAEPVTTVKVGEISIALPVPAGSVDPTHRAPKVKVLLESSTIPQKRFLAGFVSKQDIELASAGHDPELKLYFVAHTFRAAEFISIPKKDFELSKQAIRLEFKNLAPMAAPMLAKLLDNLVVGTGFSADEPRILPVSIFDETESSISATSINVASIASGTTTITDTTVTSATTMLLRGKFIYLQVCSSLSGPGDIVENQKRSRTWTQAVLSANR